MKTYTAEEYKKKYGEVGYQRLAQTKQESSGYLSRLRESAAAGVDKIKEGANESMAGRNPISTALKMGAGAIETAFSPVSAAIEPVVRPTVGAGINYVADKISDSQGFQNFANSRAGELVENAAEDVVNLSTIAGTVGGAKGTPRVAGQLKNTSTKIANTVEQKSASLVTQAKDKIGLSPKGIEGIKADWERPVNTPNASYNTASKIFKSAQNGKNGYNVAEVLAKNKVNPYELVEDGKYVTTDTAKILRENASKSSQQLLRPALEKADFFTPATPVKELYEIALERIRANTGITPGDKKAMIASLKNEFQVLEREYPDGLGLTDLHDAKITYDSNANYSPIGDPAANMKASLNKAVADAARITVERKAPPQLGVPKFNHELSKLYKSADYLEALNNKKAPLTTVEKLINRTGKAVGAGVVGSMGGGLAGGVAGFYLGDMVSNLLMGLPKELRASYLKTLSVENPEIFVQVREFLDANMADLVPDSPALPSGPIMPPPPADKSGVKIYSAEKQIYRDPKTGKMRRGYTSNPAKK